MIQSSLPSRARSPGSRDHSADLADLGIVKPTPRRFRVLPAASHRDHGLLPGRVRGNARRREIGSSDRAPYSAQGLLALPSLWLLPRTLACCLSHAWATWFVPLVWDIATPYNC